jgi:L-threonylcarbamoyladenylate synthase
MLITTDVDKAVAVLVTSGLCAIPTETVYGLAANAMDEAAVARVFAAKGRPQDHPLIIHVSKVADVELWIKELPTWAATLANAVWPGPLTLVGFRTELASDLVTGGQDTVAVRVPNHATANELLTKLHAAGILGLVAPSANQFGQVSPTSAKHVADDLGDYLSSNGDLILDGGECAVGIESTIVLATGSQPVILRPGAISASDIKQITGLVVAERTSGSPRVSGDLDSHYSPRADVVLVTEDQLPSTTGPAGLIALKHVLAPASLTRLSSPDNLAEFARTLYAALRSGDDQNLSRIYVVPPVGEGISAAINDRLGRAAF